MYVYMRCFFPNTRFNQRVSQCLLLNPCTLNWMKHNKLNCTTNCLPSWHYTFVDILQHKQLHKMQIEWKKEYLVVVVLAYFWYHHHYDGCVTIHTIIIIFSGMIMQLQRLHHWYSALVANFDFFCSRSLSLPPPLPWQDASLSASPSRYHISTQANTVLHFTAVRSDLHVPIFSGYTSLQIIGQSPLCYKHSYALQSVAQWVWLVWA